MVSAQLPLATLGHKNDFRLGRSPGLVVMGGDSRLKGCGVVGSNPGTVYLMDIFHIDLL